MLHDRPVTNIGRLGRNKPSGVTDHPSYRPLLRQYYVTRCTPAYASRKIARKREMCESVYENERRNSPGPKSRSRRHGQTA